MSQLYSMTGFSSIKEKALNQNYRFDIKSLNHRYLDIKVRLAKELSAIEPFVRKHIQGEFHRGSIEIKIEPLPSTDESSQPLNVNLDLAKKIGEASRLIAGELDIDQKIQTTDLLNYPGVLVKNAELEKEQEPSALWGHFEKGVKGAALRLKEMRLQEGAALKEVVTTSVSRLSEQLEKFKNLQEKNQNQVTQKVKEKVDRIFKNYLPADTAVESKMEAVLESRLSQELAFALEKIDVEEELSRLTGHIDHFKKVLNDKGPSGRKLEFILQEMNREVNTLSNKAQFYSLNEEAVHAKLLVDQMREQIMNLE